MILVSTLGLCRASMEFPRNEQDIVVEGERIRIASEERFTSINHSFDGSLLEEISLEGNMLLSCQEKFEVLP